MNKLVTTLALGLVFTAVASEPALVQTDFNANFSRYFEKVASDEMQGRAPATEGENALSLILNPNLSVWG